jgi:trehalose/maltose transport system substrate-binding protein
MFLKKVVMVSCLAIMTSHAYAACEISARVSILGNEFPAIQAVSKAAQECVGAPVATNLTKGHKDIQVAAMTPDPSEYTSAIVSNSTIVPLMNADLIRPLNDLLEKYSADFEPSQLIKIGDDIMAVAFMANAQHLVYRKDILEQAGIDVPKTYEEMLAAAKVLRDKGILQNPLGGAYSGGWGIAQEFNNMFLGYGGSHFKQGSAEPNVNSEAGVKALTMMKALSEYMHPDFITHNNNETCAEYEAGNVAMMNMWGSRVASFGPSGNAIEAVKKGSAVSGPLLVGGGTTPASTLFWDGWTIAKNISDAEAEATFIAMSHGVRPEILNDETNSLTVWLIPGFQPTETAVGVFKAAQLGTKPFPMLPYYNLLHVAFGAEIVDFMQGKESAQQALADVEAAYRTAAVEKGFLQ